MTTATRTYRLLIDGALVEGAAEMEVLNPATEEVVAQCPRASKSQLEAAVAAAKAAFPSWAARSVENRAALIGQIADALESRIDEFRRLLTAEQGKPLDQAGFEIMGCAFVLRAFAAMRLEPRTLRDDARGRVTEVRSPLGVVAAITPWNFPLVLLMNKVGPALLAGNTLVVKPAPTTPLTTLLFGEVCSAILPPGTINVIADANDLGGRLTEHPDIAKVAFTGSTTTGRKVMSSAAGTLKRLTLELGGNDAAIVLDDVDPIVVAKQVFEGAMLNAGQVCVAIKRAYVPAAMYDVFCNELARLATEAVTGDGTQQGVTIGPVQNRAQFERLKTYLREAHEHGTVIAGGQLSDRPGYFVPPTIVRDIADDARLVREEQFGPILPVMSYQSIDEAIDRVNASEYGLAGTVWGADVDRAVAVAARVEAGTVWVNQHMAIDPALPFRGAKQSGIGTELGEAGLEEYTQARLVNVLAPAA